MRHTIEIGARAVTLIVRRRDGGVLAYGKDVANRGGGLDNVTHGSLLRVARLGENVGSMENGIHSVPVPTRTKRFSIFGTATARLSYPASQTKKNLRPSYDGLSAEKVRKEFWPDAEARGILPNPT